MSDSFYNVLFNAKEKTCWSNTLFSTTLSPVETPQKEQFFVINPMEDRRADSNVTSFRNILVEFDSGTIEMQHALLQTSGLPYSTLTFSGSKSLHAIISVEPAIKTEQEYRAIAKAIYAKLPGCDTKVCNPSRFSRTPGAIRDNGEVQTLMHVRGRIPLEVLMAWIGPIELQKYEPEAVRTDKMLPIRVKAFLTYGAVEGSRNAALFSNACEMFRAGYSEEEVVNLVLNSPLDLSTKEIRQCVRSAKSKVR